MSAGVLVLVGGVEVALVLAAVSCGTIGAVLILRRFPWDGIVCLALGALAAAALAALHGAGAEVGP